jgi:hypothetical protein
VKVLKNNCIESVKKNTPEKITIECDKCGSELEITKEDTHIGWLGAAFVTCPCCGEDTMVEEMEGITLTKDNIEFPLHFIRTNKELRNVSEVASDSIIKEIKKGIEYFRKNKDAYDWYTSYGDLFISMYKYDEDKDYFVLVTKDFYETNIPFEAEDYN